LCRPFVVTLLEVIDIGISLFRCLFGFTVVLVGVMPMLCNDLSFRNVFAFTPFMTGRIRPITITAKKSPG
jgi:hypothetical protein